MPDSIPAYMIDNTPNDIAALEKAAQAYEDALAEEHKAEIEYKKVILAKLDSLKSVDAIMVYLQMYVFQSSAPPGSAGSDASIFGQMGGKVSIQGKELDVNSCLTAVHNDLQKLVDSNNASPTTVKSVADDLDRILDDLTGKGAIGSALSDALGSSVGDIISTDEALRNQFYIVGDTSGYNPAENNNPTGSDGYTYHFYYDPSDPNGTGPIPFNFLTNFKEMQDNMKATGNADDASGAYKSLTDNFNAMGSALQSINSATNELINVTMKSLENWQNFYKNTILGAPMTLINAAIQNQRPS